MSQFQTERSHSRFSPRDEDRNYVESSTDAGHAIYTEDQEKTERNIRQTHFSRLFHAPNARRICYTSWQQDVTNIKYVNKAVLLFINLEKLVEITHITCPNASDCKVCHLTQQLALPGARASNVHEMCILDILRVLPVIINYVKLVPQAADNFHRDTLQKFCV